jgi:hypothetical protein
MIEYFRLKIEDLRAACGGSFLQKLLKNDGAKRLPPIFNSQFEFVWINGVNQLDFRN